MTIVEKPTLLNADETCFDKFDDNKMLIVSDDSTVLNFYKKSLHNIDIFYHHIIENKTKECDEYIKKISPYWIHFHLKENTDINIEKLPGEGEDLSYFTTCYFENKKDIKENMFNVFDLIYIKDQEDVNEFCNKNIQTWNFDIEDESTVKNLLIKLHINNCDNRFEKNRIKGPFKKIICLSIGEGYFKKIVKFEDFDVLFLNTNCFYDVIEQSLFFKPDLILFYVDSSYLSFPWYDCLIELNFCLPKSLFLVCCDGKNKFDKVFYNFCRMTEGVFVECSESMFNFKENGVPLVLQFNLPTDFKGNFENTSCLKDIINFVNNYNDFRKNLLKDDIDITIAIGTFDRISDLKKAVESSFKETTNKKIEIIINDAGSTDGTIQWLEEISKNNDKIVVIFSGKKTSFTQSFNEMLQISRGQYISFFSDDFVVEKNSIDKICNFLDNMSPIDFAGMYIRNYWDSEYNLRKDIKNFPVIGAINTEVIKKYGGINSDYQFYSQDSNFTYQIMRLGGKVVGEPESKIVHNCHNDELRKLNYKKHEESKEGDKFNLIRNKNYTMNYLYPVFLFREIEDVNEDLMFSLINDLKNAYLNSYIKIESDKHFKHNRFKFDVKKPSSVVFSNNYDVIFDVYKDGIVLSHPEKDYDLIDFIFKGEF